MDVRASAYPVEQMPSLTVSDAEYRAVTAACGVVDRSERGKLALTGDDAKAFLQGQVSNDVEALSPGSGCYAAFLTPKGKMLGDIRILDAGDEILLDTERVSLQELFNMVRRFSVGYAVELHKRTLQRGLLSLLGPETENVLAVDGLGPAEDAHAPVSVDGMVARAIRTDVGLDLLCDAEDTAALTSALTERRRRNRGNPTAPARSNYVRYRSPFGLQVLQPLLGNGLDLEGSRDLRDGVLARSMFQRECGRKSGNV